MPRGKRRAVKKGHNMLKTSSFTANANRVAKAAQKRVDRFAKSVLD